MPTKKGNKAIVIYYSPEEWRTVCKKAKTARLRNGTYIRRMSVKGEIKYYELKELVTLKRAFLSIATISIRSQRWQTSQVRFIRKTSRTCRRNSNIFGLLCRAIFFQSPRHTFREVRTCRSSNTFRFMRLRKECLLMSPTRRKQRILL